MGVLYKSCLVVLHIVNIEIFKGSQLIGKRTQKYWTFIVEKVIVVSTDWKFMLQLQFIHIWSKFEKENRVFPSNCVH